MIGLGSDKNNSCIKFKIIENNCERSSRDPRSSSPALVRCCLHPPLPSTHPRSWYIWIVVRDISYISFILDKFYWTHPSSWFIWIVDTGVNLFSIYVIHSIYIWYISNLPTLLIYLICGRQDFIYFQYFLYIQSIFFILWTYPRSWYNWFVYLIYFEPTHILFVNTEMYSFQETYNKMNVLILPFPA